MTNPTGKPTAGRYLITAAALVVVVAGLHAAKAIVVPFLLAVFFAVILTPLMRFLERRGLPTVAALLVVVAAAALAGGGVVFVVGTSLKGFTNDLPEYQQRITEQVDRTQQWLEEMGIQLGDGENQGDAESAGGADVDVDADAGAGEDPFASFDVKWAMQFAKSVLGELGGIFSNAVVIFVTVILMLLEAARFPDKIRAIVGESNTSLAHVETIIANIRRYMVIKTSTSLLTGILVTVLLTALGVPYPLIWGLLAFLLNYVPNIGSILAAIPPVLLALGVSGMPLAVWTAAGFVAINCGISYLIEPRFMGQGLGLSTLVVFLSLVFWGWVLGPVGMLLSAPLTMILKIVLANYEDTRWVAVLLSPKAPKEALS